MLTVFQDHTYDVYKKHHVGEVTSKCSYQKAFDEMGKSLSGQCKRIIVSAQMERF